MSEEISDEQFFNALAETLPDPELKKIFSVYGDVEVIKKKKIGETPLKERFVLEFQSKSQLLRTVVTASKTLENLKKTYSPINDLSDDTLLKIFLKLPLKDKLNFEMVCKHWQEISTAGWLQINKLDLKEFDKKDNLSKLEIINIFRKCGFFLKDLSITLEENGIKFLPIVQKYCCLNELKSLSIKCTSDISDNFDYHSYGLLPQVFERCKNLKTFAIESDVDNLDFSCLKSLPADLLKLILSECVKDDEYSFTVDLSKFVNLRELDLSTVLIKNDKIEGFENLKNVVKLKICWRDFDDTYSSKVKLFKNLEELELIAWATSMNDVELSTIAKNCNKLKRWTIQFMSSVEGSCLKDVGKMPHLESLSLYNMNSLTDFHFGNLINIKKLDCVACKSVKDAGIIRLLRRSTNLKEMKLLGTGITPGFYGKANTALSLHENKAPLLLTVSKIDETVITKIERDFPHLKIRTQWPMVEDHPSTSQSS